MAKVTYEQAFADHAKLWSISPASDMSGGYVDQEDLAMLLASPTKKTALFCLERQIGYWFQVGTVSGKRYEDLVNEYPELEAIKERYEC